MATKESEVIDRLAIDPVGQESERVDVGRGRVVRRVGLVREDQIEREEDLETTLDLAGMGFGIGSPRPDPRRGGASKQVEALGKGLPGRVLKMGREEERRSVSDSRLVERGALANVERGTSGLEGAHESARVRARKSTGDELPRPMLVVEYLPGGTVEAFMKRCPERIDVDLWTRWMEQGLWALDRMHRKGVVHCDLKPANLLLDDQLDLVVADFSSSVIVSGDGEGDLPTDGIGRGTPPYSSPEMVDPCPTRTFGHASDVFSFGATMYSLITGCEPFRGVRSIELMWNVRKGRFWEWEERARLMRVGQVGVPLTPSTPGSTTTTVPVVSSPPSRAIGQFNHASHADGVRRTGSLRESVLSDRKARLDRPKLPRMSSSELLIVTSDTSPTSVSHPDVVSAGGRDTPPVQRETARDLFSLASRIQTQGSGRPDDITVESKKEKARYLRIDTRLSNSVGRSEPASSSALTSMLPVEAYSDGTPAMMHLNGLDRVEEAVWRTLRRMVDPVPQNRGSARDHLAELFDV